MVLAPVVMVVEENCGQEKNVLASDSWTAEGLDFPLTVFCYSLLCLHEA